MTTLLCASRYCGQPGQHLTCDTADCRGCLPRPAADGLYLCTRCASIIASDARIAANLHRDLGANLAGVGRSSERTSGTRVPGLSLNPGAVEARDAIRVVLVTLCRLISDERGITPPDDTAEAMSGYVIRHAQWLAAHPAAGEHAGDLRDVATDPRSWRIAYPSRGDRIYIGTCPLGDEPCGGRLVQHAGSDIVTCPGCGAHGTIDQWQHTIAPNQHGIVDAYAAAAHLSRLYVRAVEPGTIRKWGQRRKVPLIVEPVLDHTGSPVIDTDDLGRSVPRTQPVRDEAGRAQYELSGVVAYAARQWGPPVQAQQEVAS